MLTACGGNTGWNHLITRSVKSAPRLPNNAGAEGGRTFPSAAGFHTSQLFYSDDDGTYLFDTRDAPALGERREDGTLDVAALLEAHRARRRTIASHRIEFPREEPFVDGHNTWCANARGSTLVMPTSRSTRCSASASSCRTAGASPTT